MAIIILSFLSGALLMTLLDRWHFLSLSGLAPYFSGIVALVIALFSEKLKGAFSSVRIEINQHTPSLTQVNIGPGIEKRFSRAYLYHLKVVVKGRPLKGCRVNLIGIQKRMAAEAWTDLPMPVPHQFAWSPRYEHDEGASLDINQTRVVDFLRIVSVYMTDQTKWRLAPMLYYMPPLFQGFVYGGETTRYSVQIEAEGFTSKPYKFEVFWDGEWIEENSESMANHITVKSV